MINQSSQGGFLLLGFSEHPGLEKSLFTMALTSYLLTMVCNTLIFLPSMLNPRLHSPMYFFLSKLPFLDICFTTSFVPQMLLNLWGPKKTISFLGCSVQSFIFMPLGTTECILQTTMAFDCYVAVCQPFHYAIIHPHLCGQLVAVTWVIGMVQSVVQAPATLHLPFCPQGQIDDFSCEVPSLIQLSCFCGNITYNEIQMFVARVFIFIVPLTFILVFYSAITQTVVRVTLATGRRKAFGTCCSHLMVIIIFYSSVIAVYLQPQNSCAQKRGKFFDLFYAVGTSILNPLI
ncbi:olfactory receptor 2H2-like [Elephas maximus indicus]|uniref:olfactory receptor 2H2-like n=1 Tax=Elephas maximus indicus TaxID=99487 RepID=UPI00211611EC|nr:olfactory receptor 2H2-like [Elephas maximus indicus]